MAKKNQAPNFTWNKTIEELHNLSKTNRKPKHSDDRSNITKNLIGKQFRHKNGNVYTVLFITNIDAKAEFSAIYSVHVVYIGQNGKIWSRDYSEWEKSFTIV